MKDEIGYGSVTVNYTKGPALVFEGVAEYSFDRLALTLSGGTGGNRSEKMLTTTGWVVVLLKGIKSVTFEECKPKSSKKKSKKG